MVVVVTNRKLCPGDFLSHIHELARAKPGLIILREKDLPEAEYEILWKQCQDICSNYEVPVAVNSRLETARRQGASHLHLPLHLLRQYRGIRPQCGRRSGGPSNGSFLSGRWTHLPHQLQRRGPSPGPFFPQGGLPSGKDPGLCHWRHQSEPCAGGPSPGGWRVLHHVRTDGVSRSL